MNLRQRTRKRANAASAGVTLVEVLMALMIMSIGVTSVAVLFPISMLRSLEATQLTQAAIIKRNVETILQIQPGLLFDPDADGNLAEHFRRATSRNYIVDPVGFYTHIADGNSSGTNNYAQVFGNVNGAAQVDAKGDPQVGGVTRFGGGLRTLNGLTVEGGGLSATQAEALRLAALALAGEGDGWTTQLETNSVGALQTDGTGVIGIQLPNLDLTAVPCSFLFAGTILNNIRDPELYRVVVFDAAGKISQTFPLLYVDTTQNIVSWKEDFGGTWRDFNANGVNDARYLPAEIQANGVSRVLIQSRRVADYSWMLSVRRRSDGVVRNVDVVVKFSDGADATDERLFQATFVKDTNFVGVKYGTGKPPNIRKGKFIFDAQNARWYRIQDYRERSAFGWQYGAYDAVVITETTIADAAGEDQFDLFDSTGTVSLLLNHAIDPAQYRSNGSLAPPFVVTDASTNPATLSPVSEDKASPGNGDGVLDFGLAMFPPGIVEVYSMGSRTVPAQLLNTQF